MPTCRLRRCARVRPVPAGLVVALLLASAAPAQVAFSSAPLFPQVSSGVIADVNGDGFLDVCGKEFGGPAVYAGLADGTFAEPVGSSGPLVNSGFVLGDVNGDGRADLVAPHSFSGSSSALDLRLATLNATFLDAQVLSLPHVPGSLLLEDVSDDGVLDIVALPVKTSIVRFMLLLGHGDGTFEAAQELPTLGALFLAFGDLNGDQHTDAVLNVGSGGVAYSGITALFGQGAGSFGSPVTLFAGTVGGFQVGDVLGAGRDSIVTRGSGAELRVFTLQPHGELTEMLIPAPGLVPGQSVNLGQVLVGGPLEIVTFAANGEGLDAVFVHDGAGNFAASPEYWAPGEKFVTVTDASHDGVPDIVTAGGVVRGQGDGSFEPWYGLPENSSDLAAADVNDDGFTDVITVSGDPPPLLHLGRLDGTLQPPVALDLGPAPAVVRLVDVAGSPDVDALTLHVLFGPGSENVLAVSAGIGDGTFAPPVLTPVGKANQMALADLDADGLVDVLPWPGALVLLNAGDGTWEALSAPSTLDVLQEAAGDFDGDGRLDLIRLLRQPANILMRQVLLGHGDGTFTALPAVQIGVIGSVGSLAAVHLDADGKLDIAFLWNSNLVHFPGNGDGSFGAIQFEGPSAPFQFVDLTGDGYVDLLTTSLVVTEGSAAGLTDEVTVSPGPSLHAVVLADFNGDEIRDVAGAGPDGLMILPSASGVWQDLDHSLAGSQGFSRLQGVGSLKPGSAVHLLVKHVPPAAPLLLVLGLRAANLPLHGGLLVPSADAIVGGLVADGEGAAQLAAHWPAGVPAGTELFAQVWYLDGGEGFGATNAVVGTPPP